MPKGGARVPTEIRFPAEAARRALVAALGLSRVRPQPLHATVRELGCVQMDPMQVVAQAHLLTLRLRRGRTTEETLTRALAAGQLLEAFLHERCLLAAADLPAAVARFRERRGRGLLRQRGLEEVAHLVLSELGERGPLLAREFSTERRVASFWDNATGSMKATTMALDILAMEGRVAIVGRVRGERRYALPQLTLPGWDEAFRDEERAQEAAVRHFGRTMGLFRAADPYLGWTPHGGGGRRQLLSSMLETGEWVRVRIGEHPGYICTREFRMLLEDPPAVRGVRVLAPLDNLLWDRRRLMEIFGFHYRWEAYTPAVRRRVGPYGMPMLLDGRLVGEVDARMVRGVGLRARLVARVPLRRAQELRVERHLASLARDLGGGLAREAGDIRKEERIGHG